MYSAGDRPAATQVGVAQRRIVIDVSEEKNALLVLINPEIVADEEQQVGEEAAFGARVGGTGRACRARYRALPGSGWAGAADRG